MSKQVRKPASTGKIGPQSVSTDRNKIKNASLPKGNHERSDANLSYKPQRIKPTKRG